MTGVFRPLVGLALALAALAAFVGLVAPRLVTDTTSGAWEMPAPLVALGLITGLTYGLLAVGLVLVYRTSRIINFAHGEIGAFAAAVLGIVVIKWGIPYWVAFVLAVAVAAAVGALAEVLVVRRLARAPLVMSVVATLGLGQFLLSLAGAINQQASVGSLFPKPPGFPDFRIGVLTVTEAHTATLVAAPLVVLSLASFLKHSRFGLGLRAAAANPDSARLAGIFAGRMSTIAWAIAGALAGFTAILTQPTRGFSSGEAFGPNLLLRALACAVIARMTSLPRALAAGAALGVVEQVVLWNYPTGGFVEVVLCCLILVALLAQRPQRGRTAERGSWAAVLPMQPLPEEWRRRWAVRHLGALVAVPAVTAALLLPAVIDNGTAVTLIGIFSFAIVALSVTVVTGMAGALSLGQFAIAAIGALTSIAVASTTGNFPLAFVAAGAAAAATSLLIGLPALRVHPLMLAVTTLAFALASSAWLLRQEWAFGAGLSPGQPVIAGVALTSGRQYYYVALASLLITLLFVRNIRAGGVRRRLVAVRDNPDAARAFTVRADRTKMQGFLLAGFIAGLGGATYAHAFTSVSASTFPTGSSIDVVTMAVVGGLGVVPGALLGASFIQGLPAFVPLDAAGVAVSSFGLLLLIMYLPQGLVTLVQPVRDWVATRLAGRVAPNGVETPAEAEAEVRPRPSLDRLSEVAMWAAPDLGSRSPGDVVLSAHGLHRRFGGVRAVDGVSFELFDGETLGLIGPNGAGKTTTFELLAGFTKPDSGRVVLAGVDVTRRGPEARAQAGLVRSFQDAALFPTLTVSESVQVALERTMPTRVLPELLGWGRGNARKGALAREILGFVGLDSYRDHRIRDISTGTRRLAEIACLVAMRPTVLLLDEPSSGVAQRETEALATLLGDLKTHLGLSMVVIEHDIPMVMGLSDRVVAMAAGRVLTTGVPEEVVNHPEVVSAYLGMSEVAVRRSGVMT